MTIDQQRRMRYYTLGNIVILLLGVLIVAAGIVVGILSGLPVLDWQSILINIGSSLIVVTVIFFFGKLLLIDPQRDIEEKVDANLQNQVAILEKIVRIEAKLHSKSMTFLTRDQLNSLKTLDQFC